MRRCTGSTSLSDRLVKARIASLFKERLRGTNGSTPSNSAKWIGLLAIRQSTERRRPYFFKESRSAGYPSCTRAINLSISRKLSLFISMLPSPTTATHIYSHKERPHETDLISAEDNPERLKNVTATLPRMISSSPVTTLANTAS